ncbi:hypothetical protein HJG60_011390 [Phyllostomus discolor]|uniref:Uncharacterized protein n=1 Tax=Phyllostomus discolor TaxID=89673 RepID=A0A834A7U1_9CHIR|nr:hypothetical protein HJG60_011390 [Phyllostomus discolor]
MRASRMQSVLPREAKNIWVPRPDREMRVLSVDRLLTTVRGAVVEEWQIPSCCHAGQEKAHSGVERTVGSDDQRNEGMAAAAAAAAAQVHNPEGHENQHLHLSEFGEGAEVEANHPSLVCILLVFSAQGLMIAQVLPPR